MKSFVKPIIKSKENSEERFPGFPVITLSEIKEGSAKMVSLNTKAVDVLGLTEREGGLSRFGITRGHVEGENSEIVPFIFATNDTLADILSDAGNIVSKSTAIFNFNTFNARSAAYHNVLSTHHSDDSGAEKHFVMVEEYTGAYWRLEEFSPSDANDEGTIGVFTSSDSEDDVEGEPQSDIEITLG